MSRKYDSILAGAFLALTAVFVLLMVYCPAFFDRMWARHHNPLSWYVRPLLILPFCWFAYKKSLAGMSLSLLATATSMGWFPAPASPDPGVAAFLRMEYEYLHGPTTLLTVLGWLAVALMYLLLGMACWRRDIRLVVVIVTAAGALKALWSLARGGEAGWAAVPVALAGTAVCVLVLLVFDRRMKKKKSKPG